MVEEDRVRFRDYDGRWGDAGAMNVLARTLRTYPEEDRLHFIQDTLAVEGTHVGPVLDLAGRCLRTPHYFVTLFEYCLVHLDWRWMRTCLLHIVPRLCCRRTVAVLKRTVQTHPHTLRPVAEARHELPYVATLLRLKVYTDALRQALDALDQAMENARRAT